MKNTIGMANNFPFSSRNSGDNVSLDRSFGDGILTD